MSPSSKPDLRNPGRPDEYTRRFWAASLEASWKGKRIAGDWQVSRLDLSFLRWAAEFHRVGESLPRVWSGLAEMPEDFRDSLWMQCEVSRRRGRAVMESLSLVRSIAAKHSLRIALLKSPTYVLDSFEGFHERDVRDIDLLATADDIEVLKRDLVSHGFHHLHLRCEDIFEKGENLIEVHREALNRRRFWKKMPVRPLLERASDDPRWSPLRRLSPADDVLLLVMHAIHHRVRETLWLRDIAAWFRVRQPDPDAIAAAFRSAGFRRYGWTMWRGLERIGWSIPDSWAPAQWDVNEAMDQTIRDFWDDYFGRTSMNLKSLLLWRRLEFHQAKGLSGKVRTCLPWFSFKRGLREVLLARKGL